LLKDKFLNREAAGQKLNARLASFVGTKGIVLSLPRGGVPIGYEIAKYLRWPLDVFIVRKLGAPFDPELACGAIAPGGVTVYNENLLKELELKPADLLKIKIKEELELERRERLYRGQNPFPKLENAVVILVDDGIATGATAKAAILALRNFRPLKIILATPVLSPEALLLLSAYVDEIVYLLAPKHFSAVGAYYDHFPQIADSLVITLLKKNKKFMATFKELAKPKNLEKP
jgi:putative phosphoribosyl transferase